MKFLARVLAFVFLFTNVVFAHKPQTSVWDDRSQRKESQQYAALPTTALSPIFNAAKSNFNAILPATSFASNPLSKDKAVAPLLNNLPAGFLSHVNVRGAHKAASEQTVVLIEDVHQNAEAQAHISAAIKSFGEMPGEGKILVALEGSHGDFYYDHYKTFPDRSIADAVANAYFQAGKISGPAHAGFTSYGRNGYKSLAFKGIDDDAWYEKNIRAYTDSHATHSADLAKAADLRGDLFREKAAAFSPELRALDSLVQSHRRGTIGLGEYVKELGKTSIDLGFTLEQFLSAFEMEKSLDLRKVEAERAVVLEKLVKRMKQTDLDSLVSMSLGYQQGSVSFGTYYLHLKSLCHRSGVDLAQTPNLDNYIRYVLLADGIKADQLFADVEAAETAAYAALTKTPAQALLIKEDRQLYLADQLLNFSLTSNQWETYLKGKDLLAGRIDLSAYEAFYIAAEHRNEKMVENLLSSFPHVVSGNLGKTGSPIGTFGDDGISVLVAGGYHTLGLTNLLKKRGVSYVVATPKITKVADASASKYLSVFDREKTPLEKIFTGEKLFVVESAAGTVTRSELAGADPLKTGMAPAAFTEGVAMGADVSVLRVWVGVLIGAAMAAAATVKRTAHGALVKFSNGVGSITVMVGEEVSAVRRGFTRLMGGSIEQLGAVTTKGKVVFISRPSFFKAWRPGSRLNGFGGALVLLADGDVLSWVSKNAGTLAVVSIVLLLGIFVPFMFSRRGFAKQEAAPGVVSELVLKALLKVGKATGKKIDFDGWSKDDNLITAGFAGEEGFKIFLRPKGGGSEARFGGTSQLLPAFIEVIAHFADIEVFDKRELPFVSRRQALDDFLNHFVDGGYTDGTVRGLPGVTCQITPIERRKEIQLDFLFRGTVDNVTDAVNISVSYSEATGRWKIEEEGPSDSTDAMAVKIREQILVSLSKSRLIDYSESDVYFPTRVIAKKSKLGYYIATGLNRKYSVNFYTHWAVMAPALVLGYLYAAAPALAKDYGTPVLTQAEWPQRIYELVNPQSFMIGSVVIIILCVAALLAVVAWTRKGKSKSKSIYLGMGAGVFGDGEPLLGKGNGDSDKKDEKPADSGDKGDKIEAALKALEDRSTLGTESVDQAAVLADRSSELTPEQHARIVKLLEKPTSGYPIVYRMAHVALVPRFTTKAVVERAGVYIDGRWPNADGKVLVVSEKAFPAFAGAVCKPLLKDLADLHKNGELKDAVEVLVIGMVKRFDGVKMFETFGPFMGIALPPAPPSIPEVKISGSSQEIPVVTLPAANPAPATSDAEDAIDLPNVVHLMARYLTAKTVIHGDTAAGMAKTLRTNATKLSSDDVKNILTILDQGQFEGPAGIMGDLAQAVSHATKVSKESFGDAILIVVTKWPADREARDLFVHHVGFPLVRLLAKAAPKLKGIEGFKATIKEPVRALVKLEDAKIIPEWHGALDTIVSEFGFKAASSGEVSVVRVPPVAPVPASSPAAESEVTQEKSPLPMVITEFVIAARRTHTIGESLLRTAIILSTRKAELSNDQRSPMIAALVATRVEEKGLLAAMHLVNAVCSNKISPDERQALANFVGENPKIPNAEKILAFLGVQPMIRDVTPILDDGDVSSVDSDSDPAVPAQIPAVGAESFQELLPAGFSPNAETVINGVPQSDPVAANVFALDFIENNIGTAQLMPPYGGIVSEMGFPANDIFRNREYLTPDQQVRIINLLLTRVIYNFQIAQLLAFSATTSNLDPKVRAKLVDLVAMQFPGYPAHQAQFEGMIAAPIRQYLNQRSASAAPAASSDGSAQNAFGLAAFGLLGVYFRVGGQEMMSPFVTQLSLVAGLALIAMAVVRANKVKLIPTFDFPGAMKIRRHNSQGHSKRQPGKKPRSKKRGFANVALIVATAALVVLGGSSFALAGIENAFDYYRGLSWSYNPQMTMAFGSAAAGAAGVAARVLRLGFQAPTRISNERARVSVDGHYLKFQALKDDAVVREGLFHYPAGSTPIRFKKGADNVVTFMTPRMNGQGTMSMVPVEYIIPDNESVPSYINNGKVNAYIQGERLYFEVFRGSDKINYGVLPYPSGSTSIRFKEGTDNVVTFMIPRKTWDGVIVMTLVEYVIPLKEAGSTKTYTMYEIYRICYRNLFGLLVGAGALIYGLSHASAPSLSAGFPMPLAMINFASADLPSVSAVLGGMVLLTSFIEFFSYSSQSSFLMRLRTIRSLAWMANSHKGVLVKAATKSGRNWVQQTFSSHGKNVVRTRVERLGESGIRFGMDVLANGWGFGERGNGAAFLHRYFNIGDPFENVSTVVIPAAAKARKTLPTFKDPFGRNDILIYQGRDFKGWDINYDRDTDSANPLATVSLSKDEKTWTIKTTNFEQVGRQMSRSAFMLNLMEALVSMGLADISIAAAFPETVKPAKKKSSRLASLIGFIGIASAIVFSDSKPAQAAAVPQANAPAVSTMAQSLLDLGAKPEFYFKEFNAADLAARDAVRAIDQGAARTVVFHIGQRGNSEDLFLEEIKQAAALKKDLESPENAARSALVIAYDERLTDDQKAEVRKLLGTDVTSGVEVTAALLSAMGTPTYEALLQVAVDQARASGHRMPIVELFLKGQYPPDAQFVPVQFANQFLVAGFLATIVAGLIYYRGGFNVVPLETMIANDQAAAVKA